MSKKIKKKETENKKGFFKFSGLDKKNYRLTFQEKRFCELYLEWEGNGTEAAWESFKCKNKKVAATVASEYLRKPNVFAYIDLKLDEYGYNDENVRKQHLFVLNQMADLHAKNKAIDMYYKQKGLYAPEKKELSGSISLTKLLEESEKDGE